jgi:hypothetical protein
MGLFEESNVDAILEAMPPTFRPHFVEWCSRMRDGGRPLGTWEPDFKRGFEVVCGWLARNGSTPLRVRGRS